MKHNYTTQDLWLYASGEGSETWRNTLRNTLLKDRQLLLEFREVKKWSRYLGKMRLSPSNNAIQKILDYAHRSNVVALC